MRKRTAIFSAALTPITRGLAASVAANIGNIVARHSYLEWVLGQVIYSLLEISVKQGGAIVQPPRPRQYVCAVQDLYRFHKLAITFPFADLEKKLAIADAARNSLVHSVYMRENERGSSAIWLAPGPWELGESLEPVRVAYQPDAQLLDRRFLAKRRNEVETAIKSAERLQALTDNLLRALHERRRTQPRWNRRRRAA
ncbi:MAG TPA: hypothetical protein VN878_04465 [Usitatibacter sp.]|nr:hypothetical protein [Usitatibacter sp.]